MPSQMLLKRMVEKHGRDKEQVATTIREALRVQLARFKALYLGEGGDGAWELSMEDTITMSESFHLGALLYHGALPRCPF